jgi:putative phage-type endonuclease
MAPKVNPEDINLVFYENKDLRQPTETRLKYLREQVERLIKIPQPEQRSEEWYLFRDSMLTASDWGTILGMNPYSNSNQLLLKKCGKNVPFPSNAAIDWGVKYEDVAVQIYEQRNQMEVLMFGCIRHPTIEFLGASPDGISKDGIMLEIKCPSRRQITGVIPPYYWCQVQAQLEVCELDRCDFLECNIKEYMGKEEYLADNYEGDHSRNNLNFEKGVVMEFYDRRLSKLVFNYSPLGIIGDELDDWIINTKTTTLNVNDTYAYSKLSYWTLREVSCIPIYRNQEWFNEAYFKLKDFWQTILEWRGKGLTKLEKYIEDEKQKKRELRAAKSNKKAKTENVYIDLDLNKFNFNPNHRETNVENVEDYVFSDELPLSEEKKTSKKVVKKTSNKKKSEKKIKQNDNMSVSDDDSFDNFKFSDE